MKGLTYPAKDPWSFFEDMVETSLEQRALQDAPVHNVSTVSRVYSPSSRSHNWSNLNGTWYVGATVKWTIERPFSESSAPLELHIMSE